MEQLRTKSQSKRLFGLLKRLNWIDQRAVLAYQYSGGRTESTGQLTKYECQKLITKLQAEVNKTKPSSNQKTKMLRKFFKICYQLEWTTDEGKLDYQRIDNWLKKYSYLKKGIDEYKYEELADLITQIQQL